MNVTPYRNLIRQPSEDCGHAGTRSAPVFFLGVPVHPLTMEETVAEVAAAMRKHRPFNHVCLNVAKFVGLRRDPALRADIESADLVGVDGAGIMFAARLLGVSIPERVAGVDLMERIFKLCADEGFRPYLLGARPEVLELARSELMRRHPSLRIAGMHHGYFAAEEEAEIVAGVRASGADCIFVGMPSPRKERFMAAYRGEMAVPFVMGVGGSLDVLAGYVRRAPLAWQRAGFEWLYRAIQEPRRMTRRYLRTNTAFGVILARALLAKALTKALARRASFAATDGRAEATD